MKYFLLAAIFCTISSNAFAKEMIFYKYAEGDTYSVFVASADEDIPNLSARDVIAKKMTAAHFCIENVPDKFYSVKSNSDIAFFGEMLTQYEITPRTPDRFKHVVWVDGNGNLIKTEIYDNNDRLLFALSSVNFSPDKGLAEGKYKQPGKLGKTFYKGFAHIFTKRLPEGVYQLVFMDGLNKFSVFVNPFSKDSGMVSKVVYGNYLLSKVVSGVEYTVVGSVPYSMMEEFINVLNNSKSEIRDILKTGALITDEVYTKKTNMEEILK